MLAGSTHADLVLAIARSRDREAFTVLFDYYAPRLEAFLVRAGAERGSAEEIAQDTMATLWRKADLFDPSKSSLSTWLYRIARNRRIDRMRRDRLDYRDPADLGVDIADDNLVDAADQIDGRHREESLRGAIATLPAEQIELVRLAFFEGLSHSEIAEREGLPLGTVKSRIRLAFSRLRRTLEASGVTSAT
jgi:RNA polymerase sigma factor (sigma-70 family)